MPLKNLERKMKKTNKRVLKKIDYFKQLEEKINNIEIYKFLWSREEAEERNTHGVDCAHIGPINLFIEKSNLSFSWSIVIGDLLIEENNIESYYAAKERVVFTMLKLLDKIREEVVSL